MNKILPLTTNKKKKKKRFFWRSNSANRIITEITADFSSDLSSETSSSDTSSSSSSDDGIGYGKKKNSPFIESDGYMPVHRISDRYKLSKNLKYEYGYMNQTLIVMRNTKYIEVSDINYVLKNRKLLSELILELEIYDQFLGNIESINTYTKIFTGINNYPVIMKLDRESVGFKIKKPTFLQS